MRCAARACLLGSCILIAIVYFAVHAANSKITETYDENDALTRHLLEGADGVAAESRSGQTAAGAALSASVAIVIVISLVSVSLLITGIIIIAVTIDPSGGGDDESDIEWDSPRTVNDNDEQSLDSHYTNHVYNEL
ncbi:unnamed protein product [Nippostrongylus brasiliensis]|uniref:Col_cuticle_N domain-containing protein n=1 Tax=Nippostrongylus brasiliensis TaxID=27835 RepID=A0A0N4Y3L1_NIPBR|nr:hypothetical protein Q1695_012842 [Nippostrongylus brasiliensis]VDL73998.1 unnamed protein product [Nippostrongylus brasiliensis]